MDRTTARLLDLLERAIRLAKPFRDNMPVGERSELDAIEAGHKMLAENLRRPTSPNMAYDAFRQEGGEFGQ